MQWFRLHTEARTDRKLDTLTDAQHRVWFGLMCMAAEGADRGFVEFESPELLALEVSRGDVDLLTQTLSRLVTLRIVTQSDDDIQFVNWDKRQYDKPSDAPEQTRARKAAERERKAKQASVTPSHAESRPITEQTIDRAETEQTINRPKQTKAPDGVEPESTGPKYSADFDSFWSSYPTGNGVKKTAYAQWQRLSPTERSLLPAALESWIACERWQAGYIKACELWIRDRLWEQEPPAPKPANVTPMNRAGPGRLTTADHVAAAREAEERERRLALGGQS